MSVIIKKNRTREVSGRVLVELTIVSPPGVCVAKQKTDT